MAQDHLLTAVSTLSDDAWRDVILGSVVDPSFAGLPLPTVPPGDFQQRFTGSDDTTQNLRVGHRAYRLIGESLADLDRPLQPESRVLDLGCGWGRVIRFFLHDVRGDNLCGIDVSREAIESCRACFPSGRFELIDPWPPTSLDDASFDLVYAISVFSHLPEAMHLAWLREIARVLRPGGVLFATTLGRDMIDCGATRDRWQEAVTESLDNPHAALAEYDAGRYLYGPKPKPDYGMALIPEEYVRRRWTKSLALERFVDDRAIFHQALIVMTKAA